VALTAYALVGIVLAFTHGALHPLLIWPLVAVPAFLVAARRERDTPLPSLHLVVIILSTVALGIRPLQYVTTGPRALLAVAAVAALALPFAVARARLHDALAAAVIAALALAYALVPLYSPSPVIDVFTTSRIGVDHFLHGRNPYAQNYGDIYGGAYGYDAAFAYPPAYLLWTSLVCFVTRTLDVRVPILVAQLVLCACTYLLARPRIGRSGALVVVAAWLAFPVGLYLVENGWIDPLMLMWLAAALVALDRRRLVLAGACLGLACATKQYAVIGCIFPVVFVAREHGGRAAWRLVAVAFAVAALAIAPFAAADPRAFAHAVFGQLVHAPLRRDALSLPAFLAGVGDTTDAEAARHSLFLTLAALVAVAAAARAFWRRQSSLGDAVLFTGFAYAVVFLAGKQAFSNYYYVVAWLALAGAAMRKTA
jgi:hypothetical protein